jgi:phosphoglycolate phosphatase-like HAD superfamily hydrolase
MLVLLFDIDGTLVSTSGAGRLAMDAALAELFGVRVPIEQGSISGRTDRSIAREQFGLHGIQDNVDNWQRFIAGYLERLPASLARNGGRVLPGVVELLAELAGRPRTAVGLLTGNVPDGARIKLGHFGIDHHFRFGAYGHERYDRNHVAEDALALVRREVGPDVQPEQVWVIGDTPWDVRCAQAIGACSVAVATGFYSVETLAAEGPTLAVADLTDTAVRRAWR